MIWMRMRMSSAVAAAVVVAAAAAAAATVPTIVITSGLYHLPRPPQLRQQGAVAVVAVVAMLASRPGAEEGAVCHGAGHCHCQGHSMP